VGEESAGIPESLEIMSLKIHLFKSPKLSRSNWSSSLVSILAILAVAPSMTGCLSRSAGPSLPYVKPANSVPYVDPGPMQIASRVQDMEAEIQRLREMIERLQVSGGNEQAIRNLQERVTLIERRLGVAPAAQGNVQPQPQWAAEARLPNQQPPQIDGSPNGQVPPPAVPDASAPVEIRNTPIVPEEKAYRAAYAAFRSGSLDQAVALFDDFLTRHPRSQYAADAIYWIGEVRFGQGRFEEAVLQYDRVIKEFPGSKKELSALLKQGQAFEKMGDGKSAKIIFNKIVSEYPHTAQARSAAMKLKNPHAEQ